MLPSRRVLKENTMFPNSRLLIPILLAAMLLSQRHQAIALKMIVKPFFAPPLGLK